MTKKLSSTTRRKVPPATEAQVLIESRRRCCLCFHLHGDLGVKSGQVAHINQKRNDNNESNLTFLCFQHHDEYDSVRSQSKGLTPLEIVHAKKELYAALSDQLRPETVKITISIEGDFNKLTAEERKVLLQNALAAAQVKGSVEVLNVAQGSIKFTLEISEEDAARILSAYTKRELTAAKVIDVTLGETRRKDVRFAPTFKGSSHGISRREALDIVFNPDSVRHVEGHGSTSIGFYLKQISERHSVLIVATSEPSIAIGGAIPINRSELAVERGADPLEVLHRFLDKYGIELDFDARRSLLWIKERISIPYSAKTAPEIVQHMEQHVLNVGTEEFELVAVLSRTALLANVMNVHLMFAISKERYYPSLTGLGLVFDRRVGRRIANVYLG